LIKCEQKFTVNFLKLLKFKINLLHLIKVPNKGIASDVLGFLSATRSEKTVRDNKMVRPEMEDRKERKKTMGFI